MLVDLGRCGVWGVGLGAAERRLAAEVAAELEDAGWGAVWVPESREADVFDQCELLLGVTRRIKVAPALRDIGTRDASVVAARHGRLRDARGHRTLLGLAATGTGTRTDPVARMEAYLDCLDRLPGPVTWEERVLICDRTEMAELAKPRALGVVRRVATPDCTDRTRAFLGDGSFLAVRQAVVVMRDAEAAEELGRAELSRMLSCRTCVLELRGQGFGEDDLRAGGSKRLFDSVIVRGDAEQVEARIRDHVAAGADHVSLHVLTTGLDRARIEWRELSPLAVHRATGS